jgi:hypothetical protein
LDEPIFHNIRSAYFMSVVKVRADLIRGWRQASF